MCLVFSVLQGILWRLWRWKVINCCNACARVRARECNLAFLPYSDGGWMLSAAVWRITPTFVQKSRSFYCNASTYLVHALRTFILSPLFLYPPFSSSLLCHLYSWGGWWFVLFQSLTTHVVTKLLRCNLKCVLVKGKKAPLCYWFLHKKSICSFNFLLSVCDFRHRLWGCNSG